MKNLKYVLFSFLFCFFFLSNVNAVTSAKCVYQTSYSNVKITCFASDNTVTCTSALDIMEEGNSLQVSDFKSNNLFACPSSVYVYVDGSAKITKLSANSNAEYTDQMSLNKKESSDDNGKENETPVEPEEPKAEPYEQDARYISAKNDADKYCNEQDFVNHDSAKCESARKIMNEIKESYTNSKDEPFTPETFCQKKEIRGVFRAVGWVIYIIKILIPILLIVFGSIDIGKAVIASKDDEIKKSIKTLAIRAIAGIIIFLLPSILNFILKVVNGNITLNENSGSFSYCTHCILDPTDDSCGNLMR